MTPAAPKIHLDDAAGRGGPIFARRIGALRPAAWIIAGRMAEARRRLLHSDERIDIVAERVGYADVTHFIRMFRRTHGVTPAAWRTAQQRSPSVAST
jgi:AraC-like DNA-binding protein